MTIHNSETVKHDNDVLLFLLILFLLLNSLFYIVHKILLCLCGGETSSPRRQSINSELDVSSLSRKTSDQEKFDNRYNAQLQHIMNRIEFLERLYRPSGITTDQFTCIVCNELPRAIMTIPCRHMVLCVTCLNKMHEKHDDLCPICRLEIRSTERVFLS